MKGYLLPHPPILLNEIGKGRQFEAQKTIDAYQKVKEEVAEYQPDITFIITPHGPLFQDGVAIYDTQPLVGDFGAFGASSITASYQTDQRIIQQIRTALEKIHINTVLFDKQAATQYQRSTKVDHGALVPLIMTEVASPVIILNYGLLSYHRLYQAGIEIGNILASCERPLVIASGDLSHKLKEKGPYKYDPEGEKFDHWLMEKFERNDLQAIAQAKISEVEAAGECGMRSIQILLGILDQKKVTTKVYSYEGPFGVGYGIVSFNEEGADRSLFSQINEQKERAYQERVQKASVPVRLAIEVIEKAVREGEGSAIQNTYAAYETLRIEKKGVFVSIKCSSGLRGCIGTFLPTQQSVREEIIHNAVQASLHDPRFSPIQPEELLDLVVSVDVLSTPEPVRTMEELDPRRYGVIVTSGHKRGLLLPDLAGVDTVEEQIEIASQKAGIREEEEIGIQRFEVTRYEK